jgi:hypothetical protein
VRIHHVRNTFASIGTGASLGLPIVGKLLGHSQRRLRAMLTSMQIRFRRASNVIGDRLSSALSGRKPQT